MFYFYILLSYFSMTIKLNVEKRTKMGKTKSLVKSGVLPGVYYGRKEEATPIQMKKTDFLKVWKEAGESTVITLHSSEGDVEALIKDISLNPISNEPEHADFYVFEKGHKVEISVPIEFVGVSLAVKEKGAVLMKIMHELKIKAEPANLPHQIDVDISPLIEFGDSITAGDLQLPKGVELEENPEEIVATVAEPKEEKEEEVAPIDLTQIEVEKKGKKEEGAAPEEATKSE